MKYTKITAVHTPKDKPSVLPVRLVSKPAGPATNTAPTSTIITGVNTLTTDWVVDLVTGKKDVNDDAVWAQYLKEANAKGAQEVLNSYLAEYNEINGTDYTAVTISK